MNTLLRNSMIMLLGLLLTWPSQALGQSLRNVRLFYGEGEFKVVYDLWPGASGSSFTVELYYSYDGGESFQGPAQEVDGDIGQVNAGNEKQIHWQTLKELGPVAVEKFQVELRAKEINSAAKGDYPEMVLVEGGTFQMGSTDGESFERPIHLVKVSDFWIGKYEVTVKEFAHFIKESGYQTQAEREGFGIMIDPLSYSGSKKSGASWRHNTKGEIRTPEEFDHPVLFITREDALAYCQWLAFETGKHYRLLTEAEWEFAARGGNKSKGYKYAGSNDPNEVGWFLDNANGLTHPVGSKKPNELGLYDMSGNVWEWCVDRYHGNYQGAPIDGAAWSSGSNKYWVIRSGCWLNESQHVRNCNRSSVPVDYRLNTLGFRIAMSP